MIPREILKKIRQIEIRANHVVTESAVGARASARFTVRTTIASNTNSSLDPVRTLKRRERRAPDAPERGCVRIPTGFCLKAQGCAPGATLGHLPANIINRNAVAAMPFSSVARDVCHNPVGVVLICFRFPRVARSSQPWAGGHNPFGIARIARIHHSTFNLHHFPRHDPPRNPQKNPADRDSHEPRCDRNARGRVISAGGGEFRDSGWDDKWQLHRFRHLQP